MIFLSLGIIFIDQLTKFLAFKFGYIINYGVAFSIGSDIAGSIKNLIILLFLAYLFFTYMKSWKLQKNIAELVIFSSGISNLFDRFCYGGVIDFISFTINISSIELITPVFNIADIIISLGVAWIVWRDFGRKLVCKYQQSAI